MIQMQTFQKTSSLVHYPLCIDDVNGKNISQAYFKMLQSEQKQHYQIVLFILIAQNLIILSDFIHPTVVQTKIK